MMRRVWTAALAAPAIGLIALAVIAAASQAQVQHCEKADESTEIILSGVTVTYDSSYFCTNAADQGEYAITVSVANRVDSSEAVTVDRLELSHTTPRPGGGSGPEATATAGGLPITVASGETARFDVRGIYALVTTDEGAKANLHLHVVGTGATSSERLALGINVHLRAAGSTEDDDPAERPEQPDGTGPGEGCGQR